MLQSFADCSFEHRSADKTDASADGIIVVGALALPLLPALHQSAKDDVIIVAIVISILSLNLTAYPCTPYRRIRGQRSVKEEEALLTITLASSQHHVVGWKGGWSEQAKFYHCRCSERGP